MNILVDVSVILAVITNEKRKYRILEVTKGCSILAPSIMDGEILKTITNMYKRQWLRLNQVKEAFEIYQNIPIRTVSLPLGEVSEFAIQLQITANDAAYVFAASKYKCPLYTYDENVKVAANKSGVKLVEE